MKKTWIVFGLLSVLTVLGWIGSFMVNRFSYLGVIDYNWPALEPLSGEQESALARSVQTFNLCVVLPFWVLLPLWIGFSITLLFKLKKEAQDQ